MHFTIPFGVILVQNSTAAFLSFIIAYFGFVPLKPIQLEHLKISILPSISYVFLLWTSLEGLAVVSVPLIIIGRNLVPFVTMLSEKFIFGQMFSKKAYVALGIVVFGSVNLDSDREFPGTYTSFLALCS